MGSCKPRRQFAKQNARNYLLLNGVIDQYNNILDQAKLTKAMNIFRNHALKEYNFRADFLLYEDTVGSNKVIFNQSAFMAVDVLKGTITNAVMDQKTLAYVNQAKISYEPGNSPAFDNSFFEDNQYEPSDIPTQGLTRLVSLKTSLLHKANQRLSKLKPELVAARDDAAEHKRLLRLQTDIKDRIEGNPSKNIKGLEEEIRELDQIDTRAPELIAPYIVNELGRLDTLVKSTDPAQIREAHEIIDFIKAMADFNPTNIEQSPVGHPLYHIKELYDENNNFLLTDAMVAPFKQWADIAQSYDNQLAAQDKAIFVQSFNNNDKIKQLFDNKKFEYAEIVSSGLGLKDASWIDSMVMDISSGILSHNGLIPGVVKNIVDNQFETEYAWAKEIEEKIDNLTPGVVAELKKMGYSLNGLGILGINGVSYDLFKQMIPNSNNQSSGNIAHKYSYKWFEDKSEMESQFWKAVGDATKTEDPNQKAIKFKQAIDYRNAWFKNNTQIVDLAQISSIATDPEFASISQYFTATPEQMKAHEDLLESIAGRDHLDKTIDNQKTKLRTYIAARELAINEFMALDNVTSEDQLSEPSKKGLAVWEAERNPFIGVDYRNQPVGTINQHHSKLEYNEYLPVGAEFYDTNYAKIEANPTLKQFYDVVYSATSGMKEKFPYDVQQKMLATSVPFLEKNIMELMTDENTTFFQAISAVFRRIWDNFKSMFGVNIQNQISYAQNNTNTGLPDYKVNDAFIKQNANKINDLFLVKKNIFNKVLGVAKITRFSSVEISSMTDAVIENLSQNYMGKRLTRAELQAQFGTSIPVGKIIYRASQHEVAQEKSFDLPKVIKLYSHLAAQYTAREEILPLVLLMKDHYTKIKNQVTTNMGQRVINADTGLSRLDGFRENANKQFEDWLQRVVIGQYGLVKHYNAFQAGTKLNPEEQEKWYTKLFTSAIKGRAFDGKIYDIQEKKLSAAIDTALKSATDPFEKEQLQKMKDNLGKDFTLSAVVDSILNFIRFKGLGFNISSGINNFIEGQIANSITASTGNYFNPEFIYELSPSEMIAGNLIKQTNPGSVPEKVAKAEFLSKAGDILQDNTNDLQRASTKSAFSFLKRFNPYYINAKTEQYNQIPLMVATLKSTQITGVDGTISNVWDALQGEYLPASKQWTVKLKPGFDTKENKESWEDYNGSDYRNWKAQIKQVIANTHGDFSDTGGMRAKSFQAGKAVLQFKTWLPREFYKRFAVQQTDVAAGVQGFKGRWRSHTPVTAAMQGALIGTYFMGPVGFVAGAVAGGTWGKFVGSSSSLNLLQELALTNKLLARKLFGMPLNLIGSAITKKRFNTQLSDSHFADMEGKNFTKQDFNNFRGNMQEMSMMLMWFGFILMTKALFWDDDDKGDSPRRQLHNILANRFMQLAGSGMMFTNLVEMQKTVEAPFIKFIGDVGKLVLDTSEAVFGNDTLITGPNAGESKAYNQLLKTALPGVIADPNTAGFGKQTQRQFVPTPFDSYFFGPEKEAQTEIKKKRAARRKELLDEERPAEEIDAIMKAEFPRKGKDQNYQELLDQIEGIEKEEDEEPENED